MQKNIVIIGTGGTIASTSACDTEILGYSSVVITINSLIASIPALNTIANVSGEQIAQIDSCNMTHEIWLKLANRINQLLASNKVDGIVVTHGTDTMEETAYFLNLVIKSEKPVVLVGAMRPANAISADGPMNLYNAVVLAASQEAKGNGVLVTMNNTINCSRDVTKTNITLQDTFKSPELGYLGYIHGKTPSFYRSPARKHTVHSEFNVTELSSLPSVDIAYAYIDSTPIMINAAVSAGAKGLIYAGLGNGGMSESMKSALTNISKKGIVIVRSSRVSSGIVTRNDAVNDDLCNFVVSDTLNPQKARILLMLALTKTTNTAAIQKMFWKY